ncbi:unnamed protein product [Sphagnum jensenii]|uniref:RCC1-like domain-containing protein n=1 Tax=Sphagnum jensenii TaxID=128206 RepID=A0ABP0WEM4_9BRYO
MAAGAENGSEDPKAMTVVQLVAGEAHTLALTEGGSVYAWGRGIFGRLGIGVAQDELFPTYVEIGTDGDNDSQGSSSYYTDSPLAIRDHDHRRSGLFCDRDGVFQQNKIVQVAAGAHHSLALSGDGTVWSWGFNACIQPHLYFSLLKHFWESIDWVLFHFCLFVQIVSVEAGGMMTSAVDQDGGLWLWGAVPPPSAETDNINRSSSSLPDKNETFSLVNIEKPERVHALIGQQVLRVACGNEHIMALVKARVGLECFSWGSNSYGQLGLGHSEPCAVPQLISSLSVPSIRTITDLACGAFHSVVLTVQEDHHHHQQQQLCWTFGQGENGQLGHGGSMNLSTPAPVDGLPSQEHVRTVVCGQFHTAAVTETGDVWVWGMEGGLGLCPGIGPPGARKGDALTPVRVFGESSAKCHPVMGSKGITCGAAHTVTVANGGAELWAWGRGQSGVLGLGHSSDSWFPSPVVWPPNPVTPSGKENLVEREVIVHFDSRKSRMEMRSMDVGGENGMSTSDEVRALKTELASLRRYAESLHAALYGGAEAFSTQILEDHPLYDTVSSDGSKHLEQIHGAHNRQPPGQIAIREWQQHIETATEADLVWLELFYRDMRNHVKDILFQRRMEDWCRRCMSTLSSSSFQEPPPMPERFSAPNTPSIDGPRQFAMQMSGLLSDRSNMLPPAALAASIAEFQALSQRSSSRR